MRKTLFSIKNEHFSGDEEIDEFSEVEEYVKSEVADPVIEPVEIEAIEDYEGIYCVIILLTR